jgi:ABC-type antimicrobial peptide transport system permease subunit
VTSLLVRHGAVLLAGGVAAGLVAAIGVTRLLQTELHGVQPFDPLTLAATCLVLGSAGLLATWWPAQRASRRNPVSALKGD